MSRYYDVQITDQGEQLRRYTSYPNGVNDPGALRVNLDLNVFDYSAPSSASFVRVMGVPFTDLTQALNLNGKAISVSGGFQKGLPLANPSQAGLLVQGTIFQAFGNWLGTEMSLDLQVVPPTGSSDTPVNLVLNWKKGTTLADALASTLTTAFPGFAQKISISPKLVLSYDQQGYYQSLLQFTSFVRQLSRAIVGGTYNGVSVTVQGSTIVVYDGSSATSPKQINFNDLIGQPTWLDPGTIQVTMAMRADLRVSDYVKMPPATTGAPGTAVTTAQALSTLRQGSVFQGTFIVSSLRHVGDSRLPDAQAWVTVANVNPVSS